MAYVEWFMPLCNPVPELGMYQISRSTCGQCRCTSIIPVSQIECLVHLIPKFGREINQTWSVDDVLELCKTFYINPYVQHLDFLLFHYLLS
jgi:hypothetical protein